MKLILVAEDAERKLVEQWFAGIDVLVTGVGAINIFQSLQSVSRDTEIINVGYAGSANFEVGSWVEVSKAQLNHPNVSYPEAELPCDAFEDADFKADRPKTIKAVCYTGVDFVLQSNYQDCVFDMELAFIKAMGFRSVKSLKYVSDNLSLHEYRELGQGV